MNTKIFFKIFFWVWSQPQTLIGWIIHLITKEKANIVSWADMTIHSFVGSNWGAISLGRYCFHCIEFRKNKKEVEENIRHEYGHSIQSLAFGPMFLILFGLPSILWATYCRLTNKDKDFYYKFYTEKMANALGGVITKDTKKLDGVLKFGEQVEVLNKDILGKK